MGCATPRMQYNLCQMHYRDDLEGVTRPIWVCSTSRAHGRTHNSQLVYVDAGKPCSARTEDHWSPDRVTSQNEDVYSVETGVVPGLHGDGRRVSDGGN